MQMIDQIPRNVILDFGGVLAPIRITAAVDGFRELGMTGICASDIHPLNRGIFLEYEKGLISPEVFFRRLRQEYPPTGPAVTDSQLSDAWNSIILPYDYSRFKTVMNLRRNGHRVFLLSNTNLSHHEYFEDVFDRGNPYGLRFRDIFDKVYYSDEMKMRKPDREIYEAVLADSSLAAEETLFVDDNIINLAAPENLGMKVYHFRPEDSLDRLFGM